MDRKKITLETPYGTKDLLPIEAIGKRNVEQILSNLFISWGYDEVVTPTIEYLDTLAPRIQSNELSLFKFFSNNKTLALRNELTTPIARLVSSRFKDTTSPLKLSYIGNVFRFEQTQMGRQCEFHQAGVELMGSNSPSADAEIIALAIEAILKCGIEDFQICMGQVNFLTGILTQFHIEHEYQKKLKDAIECHDIVLMNSIIDSLSLTSEEKDILRELPLLNGTEEILQPLYKFSLNEQTRAALENLAEIYQLLKSYCLDQYVRFDFSIIRDFDYYTGMVFEGYAPGLGFPLCGGGRYDHLLENFGRPRAATGFAIGIERILLTLERQGIRKLHHTEKIYVSYTSGKVQKAIQMAKNLRQNGKIADLGLEAQSFEEAEAFRQKHGYDALEYIT